MKFDSSFSSNKSMISDSNLILYACISKGTTVLTEISSGDHDLETLALKCLENTPSFHFMFSHTVGKKIYLFLMEDPFVYFAILDEDLGKQQGLRFLEHVKDAFMKVLNSKSIKDFDDLTNHCFHEEFSPIFRHLMASSEKVNVLQPLEIVPKDSQSGRLDSMSGKKAVSAPLLGKPSKHTKKKKKVSSDEMKGAVRDIPMENKVDVSDDANLNREFSVSLQKNGHQTRNRGRHQAQKMWWQYVRVVLIVDLIICCALFGVWLLICRGFQCISE